MSSHIYAEFCFVFKNYIAQVQIACISDLCFEKRTHMSTYACSRNIITHGQSGDTTSRQSVERAALANRQLQLFITKQKLAGRQKLELNNKEGKTSKLELRYIE